LAVTCSLLDISQHVAVLVSIQRAFTHVEQHQAIALRVSHDRAAADLDIERRHHDPTTCAKVQCPQ